MEFRHLLFGIALATGACTAGAPPLDSSVQVPVGSACTTSSAKLSFDFEAASFARCVIEGEREFSVLVAPEHQPPINPSPWYAFRYEASEGSELTVHLRYLGAKHRYEPKWSDGTESRRLSTEASEDGTTATMQLPPGRATVSAQEIIDTRDHEEALERWAQGPLARRFVLGSSHDRRPIGAVRLGLADAPRLVVLLGRQHPPEVTGAIAMESFVDRIAALLAADPQMGKRYQFLVIPLLNPDGVARGNWRANLGGKDINRDWGEFSQPETQAIKGWLDALPAGVRPVLMLDFHSTHRNLFYVQGDEASERQEQFLGAWLAGKENSLPGYIFSIERRNANPGSGTAKNWFHQTYGIPAYTYEVADDADRMAIRQAAAVFARGLPEALEVLER